MSTHTFHALLRFALAVVLLMSPLGSTSALAQSTGLAGAWSLNRITGTTIEDSSGNGRAGTVSGGPGAMDKD
jgi:hypothetical protein